MDVTTQLATITTAVSGYITSAIGVGITIGTALMAYAFIVAVLRKGKQAAQGRG